MQTHRNWDIYLAVKMALLEVEQRWYDREPALTSLRITALEDDGSTLCIEAGVKAGVLGPVPKLKKEKGYNLPEFLTLSDRHVKDGIIGFPKNFTKRIQVIAKPRRTFYGISNHLSRPLVGGVSCMNSNYKGPGTLGALLKLKDNGHTYAISNWHVFVNSNGRLGDKILQPCRYDGGKFKSNQIGDLVWYRLDAFMDAALVKVSNDIQIGRGTKGQGKLSGTIAPVKGMVVEKYGRTTGNTTGVIEGFYESIKVSHPEYPNGNMMFRDQILCDLKADWGDSGALLTTPKGEVVGLVFASDFDGACLANTLQFSRPLQAGGKTGKMHGIIKTLEIEQFN